MQVLNQKFLIFIILAITLIILIVPVNWQQIKFQVYPVIRNLVKVQLSFATRDYGQVEGDNFVIIHKGVNKKSVSLVAETAEEIFAPVNRLLDFTTDSSIPVVLYSTMEDLNKSFGWEGDKSPMGVYWMGSIRILAPEVWIEEGEEQEIIFKNMGPMAHEYTHLVVDYKTNGNYTRWFTEGIAQYVEKKITGFTLDEPDQGAKQEIYPFSRLDGEFDEQKNQDLAYWQSLMAIEYLVEKYGEEVINEIIYSLGKGQSLSEALQVITGLTLDSFEQEIREYVILN